MQRGSLSLFKAQGVFSKQVFASHILVLLFLADIFTHKSLGQKKRWSFIKNSTYNYYSILFYMRCNIIVLKINLYFAIIL